MDWNTTLSACSSKSFPEEEEAINDHHTVVWDGDSGEAHRKRASDRWIAAALSDHRAKMDQSLHIPGCNGRRCKQRHRLHFVLCWTAQSDARTRMDGRFLIAATSRSSEDDDGLVLPDEPEGDVADVFSVRQHDAAGGRKVDRERAQLISPVRKQGLLFCCRLSGADRDSSRNKDGGHDKRGAAQYYVLSYRYMTSVGQADS
jgi:hypothetical protein